MARVAGPAGQWPNGTEGFEQTSRRDGDIVTTTTHPDGSVTIETEALEGTVQGADQGAHRGRGGASLEGRDRDARSLPPRHRTSPDRPQAWLLDHVPSSPATPATPTRPGLVDAADEALPEAIEGDDTAGPRPQPVGDGLARHPARRLPRSKNCEVLTSRSPTRTMSSLRVRATRG